MSNHSHFSKKEDQSSDKSHQDEQKGDIKCPEFVLIDDRNGEERHTHFNVDASQHPQEGRGEEAQNRSKSPLSLRFICFLGFIFCLIFGLGMLMWSVVMSCLATLSLFQNPNLNKGTRNFWKIFVNTCVAGFGFTLGLISPTLGLGMLAIYFSLKGNLVEDDFLRKVIRRSFSHL